MSKQAFMPASTSNRFARCCPRWTVTTDRKPLARSLHPRKLSATTAPCQHEGAKSGGGHFAVTIVSPTFQDKSPVQRHQMIYQALGDMMKKEIHALSIQAFTPDEL
jgi:BolA protein